MYKLLIKQRHTTQSPIILSTVHLIALLLIYVLIGFVTDRFMGMPWIAGENNYVYLLNVQGSKSEGKQLTGKF